MSPASYRAAPPRVGLFTLAHGGQTPNRTADVSGVTHAVEVAAPGGGPPCGHPACGVGAADGGAARRRCVCCARCCRWALVDGAAVRLHRRLVAPDRAPRRALSARRTPRSPRPAEPPAGRRSPCSSRRSPRAPAAAGPLRLLAGGRCWPSRDRRLTGRLFHAAQLRPSASVAAYAMYFGRRRPAPAAASGTLVALVPQIDRLDVQHAVADRQGQQVAVDRPRSCCELNWVSSRRASAIAGHAAVHLAGPVDRGVRRQLEHLEAAACRPRRTPTSARPGCPGCAARARW